MKQENVFFISIFTFMVCALLIGFEVCMNSYVIVIMIIAMIAASLSTIDLDDEYDYDDYGEESFEKIKQQLSAQEKVPYYKNHPYEEEKEEKPPYLFVIIISIIVGVLSGSIAT